jgi:hypothetical protein
MRTLSKWGVLVCLSVLAFAIGAPVALAATTAFSLTSASGFAIAGATLAANVPTLADWAKRQDPSGKTATIVNSLTQTNAILEDMSFVEGNLPTGMRTTILTGLPSVYWRLANQGTPPSKSTTAQVDEQAAVLEAWSEVDPLIARLNGDVAAFRESEGAPFREAMSQEMAQTLFYGNAGTSPEEFTGLSARYSTSAAGNGGNIIKAGGAGADNTSIWLIGWGPNAVTGFFPKGQPGAAGLYHEDLGLTTVHTTAGLDGNRMRAYQEMWQWQLGLAVRDWRYAVRIANIDISALLLNDATSANLFQLMTRAIHRIPNGGAGVRLVFYANRTVSEYLDIQGQDRVSSGGQMSYQTISGQRIVNFAGIPIKTVDALLETEATVP